MYEAGSATHEFNSTIYGVRHEFFIESSGLRRAVIDSLRCECYEVLDRVVTDFPGEAFMLYVPIKESHWISSTYVERDRAIRSNFETCRGEDAGWIVMYEFIRRTMPEHVSLDTHIRRLARDRSDTVKEFSFEGSAERFLSFALPFVRKIAGSCLYVVESHVY